MPRFDLRNEHLLDQQFIMHHRLVEIQDSFENIGGWNLEWESVEFDRRQVLNSNVFEFRFHILCWPFCPVG